MDDMLEYIVKWFLFFLSLVSSDLNAPSLSSEYLRGGPLGAVNGAFQWKLDVSNVLWSIRNVFKQYTRFNENVSQVS